MITRILDSWFRWPAIWSLTVLAALATVFLVAQAATKTWDGGVSGTGSALNTGTNWVGDAVPTTSDEALMDNSVVATLPSQLTTTPASLTFGDLIWNTNNSSTITIDTTNAVSRTLTLSGGGGSTSASAAGGASGDLLLMGTNASSNTLSFTGNVNTGSARLSIVLGADGNFDVVNSGATLNNGVVTSGNFNLTKTGAGKLTLSGANTFGGAGKTFKLSAGTLNINNATALGAAGNTFQVDAGTIDNTTGASITVTNNNPLTLNGDFTFTGGSGTTHDLNFGTGAVSLGTAAGTTRTITTSAGTLTTGGIISNGTTANSLTKSGAGTLALSGANTYTGTTTISTGTLALNGTGSLATSKVSIAGGATFDVSGHTFTVTLTNSQTLEGTGTSSTGTINGNLTMGSTSPISLSYASGNPTLTVTNGTLTLQTGEAVTVTNNGAALSVGDYKLIAKGTGGSVSGAPTSTPVVNGTGGLAAGTTASLVNTGNELYLHVTFLPPTIQASSLTFAGVQVSQMGVYWTNGNGTKRIVKMNTANSFANPVDGTDPAANTVYGGGEQVVFNGAGSVVGVTGLSAGTTYWFRVYEYNGSGSSTVFLTSTATNNPNSQATPPSLVSIAVTPANPTIILPGTQQFTATGTFSDSSSRALVNAPGTWSSKASMVASGRTDFAAAALLGRIYVAGGGQNVAISSVEAYDPVANSWTTRASLPTTRIGGSAATVGNKMYVMGGNAPGVCGAGLDGANLAYDPSTDSWTAKASMPTPRAEVGLAVINGLIYAAGGYNIVGCGSNGLTTLEVYDPVANTWASKASMSLTRLNHATATTGGKIYVIGGYGAGNVPQQDVQIYDPGTNSWSTGAAMPTARGDLSAIAVNGKIYAIGGYNGSNINTVEIYDPVANTWSTGPSLSTGRASTSSVEVGGTAYTLGGCPPSFCYPAVATNEALALGEVSWSSSDTSRATISLSGLATAVAFGTTNITATDGTVSGNTTLTVSPSPPTIQASNITFAGVQLSQMGVYWTNGNGTKRIVKMNTANSFTNPVDGTDPAANTVYGGAGEQVVFNGAGSVVGVTGLSAGATYWFRVYEYNGSGTSTVFLTTTATNNPKSQATPPSLVSITVTPANPTILLPGTQQFTAMATFSDSSSRALVNAPGTWSSKASMVASGRTDFAAAALLGRIFVAGGAQSGGGISSVEVYDPAANSWATKASLPTTRVGGSAATVGNKMYVMGGNAPGVCGAGLDGANLAYDPSTDSWTAKASMPTPRAEVGLAVINGLIYAAGGYNIVGCGSNGLTTLEVYDPVANTWASKASMPLTRVNHATATTGGKIYVIGGYTVPITAQNDVQIYDPGTNSWSTGAAMPTARGDLSAIAVNGKIYAIGGYNGSSNINTVEIYDPVANTWSTGPNLITGRASTSSVEVGGTAYTLGGCPPSFCYPAVTTNEALALGEVSWSSSDTSKATISLSGLATAVAFGSTTITATDGTVSGNTTLTVSPAPEIDVKGNGISIVDGDTSPSVTDDTEFGSINIGDSVVHTFTIYNTGTGTLNISGISISGVTGGGNIFASAAASSTVAPGGSTTFTVTVQPASNGLKTATVNINNDDSDENPYNFTVQGTGVTPKQFRSKSPGGAWDSTGTWEQSTDGGSTWGAATTTPAYLDGAITIRNGHVVFVLTSVTTDQTTIEAGASLFVGPQTFTPTTLTINDGTGDDLTVNGTLRLNSDGFLAGQSPTYASGSLLFYNGGGRTQGVEWSASPGSGTPGYGQPDNLTVNGTINPGASSDRSVAGTLTMSGLMVLNADLNLYGDLTDTNSSIDLFTYNNHALVFRGGNSQTLSKPITFNVARLTVNKTANALTLNSSTTCTTQLTLTNGTLAVGSATLTLNSGVAATSGTLTSGAAGTVNYNQSSNGQNVLAADYGNLAFSNFNKTLASSGTIGITTGFSPGTATGHTVTGSTIEYHLPTTGVSTTVLPPLFTHYDNLRINELGNTVGPSGLVVDGTLEILQGTFTSASDYHNVIINPGATLALANDITVGGNWINNGTFNANGFKVTFDGSGPQTIGGSNPTTFATLQISNTGSTVSLTQNISDTALNVTSGTFDQGSTSSITSGTVTVSSGATWRNIGSGDVTLSGGVSNAGTVTLQGNGATCGQNDDILIRSSVNGTQRSWSGTGTFSINDVDVKDQAGTAIITAFSSTNSGNNAANWIITSLCTTGQVYTWVGGTPGFTTDWTIATNWSPTRTTPANTDIIVINNGFTPTITNVPSLTGTQTIAALRITNGTGALLSARTGGGALTINGATGSDLEIDSGSSLTLQGAGDALTIDVDGAGSTGVVAGQIVLQDGAHQVLATNGATITFSGPNAFTTAASYSTTTHPFGTGTGGNGSNNSIIFAGGAGYTHNNGLSPFGDSSHNVVIFQTGSSATFLTANGFAANARAYANLVIGSNSVAVAANDSGTGNFQFDNLTVNSTGSSQSSLQYSGSGASAITIQGNITSTGNGNGGTAPDVLLTSGSGGIQINGTATGGTVTYSNSGGAPAHGILFSGDATLAGSTTLNLARIVQLGSGANTITANGTLAPNQLSAAGFIVGAVRKPAVPASYTFPVGTVSGYTPVSLTNASGGGDLTVLPKPNVHPNVNGATSLKEYWTLTLNGGSLTTDLTFHYLDSDVQGTESNYRVIRVEGGTAVSFPNDGCVSACVDTTNNNGTLIGIPNFSDWTLGEPAAPTAVKLTRFEAASYDDGVQLNWESGFEVNNLGYHVYRERIGLRERVTPALVGGSALKVGPHNLLRAGFAYSWFDNQGTPETAYYLEAIDLNGTRDVIGPIYPTRGTGNSPATQRRAALLSELSTGAEPASTGRFIESLPVVVRTKAIDQSQADSLSPATQTSLAGSAAVKISVSRAGWYRVTQAELLAGGLDANADPRRLQMFVEGEEIPIIVNANGKRLEAGDSIEFYGQGLDTLSTGTQVYWLINGTSGGKRLTRPKSLKPGNQDWTNQQGGSFAMSVARQDKLIYFSGLLNGEESNIFGPAITSFAAATQTLTVNNLDATSSQAQLSVSLQGVTEAAHQVLVQLNGTPVGVISFDGRQHPQQDFTVSRSLLNEGANLVSLAAGGGDMDVSLIDSVTLTYAHAYRADNNALRFSVPAGRTVIVSGFSSAAIRVIDITNPSTPSEVAPQIAPLNGGYAFKLQTNSTGGTRTYLAFTDDLAAHPAALTANQPSNLTSLPAADMLIVTHKDFRAAVEPLAAQRRSEGLTVAVVDIEDVYDEFSFGAHSPQALRDFLSWTNSHWTRAPRYLLLVGDSSWDPRNYLDQGFGDFVPTKLIDTGYMETASDDWLTDFDGDGIADVATGRLPARTAADASVMVNKILAYEHERQAGTPLRGALMVADSGFESESQATAGLLPGNIPVTTINRADGSDDLTRTQIVNNLNNGPLVANYFGHGSVTVWTGAGLLDSDLAVNLTNVNRPTLFVLMTCLNGYAHDAYIDSLGESLLRAPHGGAMAVWASSGFTESNPQFVMSSQFYRQLFGATTVRLGDAFKPAKLTISDPDVQRTWLLLGDPSMRLR